MTFIATEILIHLLKAFAIDIMAACDKRGSPTMVHTNVCMHVFMYASKLLEIIETIKGVMKGF